MIKTIFYKEWIKTRFFFVFSFVALIGFSLYNIFRVYRAISFKGIPHIWEVMITRDAIFINMLEYVPLIIGILFALFQFAPEMRNKCLKLTLHLPHSPFSLTMAMVGYGVLVLTGMFLLTYLLLMCYFKSITPIELEQHVLFTTIPWFLAGVLSYIFTSWICLEPTWKRRIAYLFVAAPMLRLFFMSDKPESYNDFLPYLFVYVLLSVSLLWTSILRFKAGKQD